jgi:hemoglobin
LGQRPTTLGLGTVVAQELNQQQTSVDRDRGLTAMEPPLLAKTMCVDSRAKRELNSPEAVAALVDVFYAKVVADAVLGPVFKDIDLRQHKPKVRAYWRKMLLGERDGYRRNMIAQHKELHARHPLQHRHFQRWLALFLETVDERFSGCTATRARRLASTVAIRLEALLTQVWHQGEGHARE